MSDEGGGASRSTDPAAGSSAATDVSLREYFNEKIHADRKLNNERFLAAGALGAVIWFFIERHLSDLNHENARVAAVSERSISQDTYTANEQQRTAEAAELSAWRKEVDRDRTQSVSREELTRETKVDHRAGASLGWQAVAALVGFAALIVLVLSVYLSNRTPTPIIVNPTRTVTTAP